MPECRHSSKGSQLDSVSMPEHISDSYVLLDEWVLIATSSVMDHYLYVEQVHALHAIPTQLLCCWWDNTPLVYCMASPSDAQQKMNGMGIFDTHTSLWEGWGWPGCWEWCQSVDFPKCSCLGTSWHSRCERFSFAYCPINMFERIEWYQ